MADFLTAYKVARANEGGYRNVSYDVGGETYKGVARNYWPNWAGWKIVDAYKAKNGPIKHGFIIPDAQLDSLVHKFFMDNFWAKNLLNFLKNQSLATLALDMSINHGRGPKIINEQAAKINKQVPITTTVNTEAVNVLNSNPEQAYKLISAARVAYVESLKDQLGPDYSGVLARAKSFLTKYSTGAVASGIGIVLAAVFFF
jgi:lysozyme family protein